ncbi:uncharacterized protein V1510DRAFT_423446 [Dipodascopsis tothii]|uniref:uncharacterized protein n=1 Tax=Dipodascopsis tothii TaxID=44089 RepID=UPI0034CEFF62
MSADELKAQGNAAFAAKDFDKAIDLFTQAIAASPTPNHVLYSNRSGSYASKRDFENALKDAEECVKINSTWAKGYTRKATALHGLGDLIGAKDTYEEVLKLDPANAQAKSGLKAVDDAIAEEAAADGQTPDMGMGQMFNDSMWGKLAANPKTSAFLADAAFVEKLKKIQKSPGTINTEMTADPRMMQVIAVLLGLDLQMPPQGAPASEPKDTPMPDAPKPAPKAPEPAKAPEPEPEPEEDEEAKAKKEADEAKALGNKEYKARNFDVAIGHYDKAWELHKDITYLNNKAAAEFEKGDYETCIATCKFATEEGRFLRTDYKVMAKSFARIGTAYQKLGDWDSAIEYYGKSLTEHRSADILAKLRTAEKEKKRLEQEAYVSPELAEAAREEGNAAFKNADWPAAVKAYTEMIKRAPADPRGYSNRAAAYAKLLSFPEAIKDCDDAISKDPSFVRAYIRKANAYFAMREYSKCIDTLNAATEKDVEHKSKSEIDGLISKAYYARFQAQEGETEQETMERISKDPEVVSVLQDPVMQAILGQARENPAALNDHMKNPEVRRKIELLMAAGIIRTR